MDQKRKIRLHGQAVKTLASHAGIRGSIPLGVIHHISRSSFICKDLRVFTFLLKNENQSKSKPIFRMPGFSSKYSITSRETSGTDFERLNSMPNQIFEKRGSLSCLG